MSSKRRLRRNACTGKKRYTDTHTATTEMHAILRKNPDTWRMNVYACQFCKGWHFGHAPRR